MAGPERTDDQDEAREKEIGESRQKLALAAVPLLFMGLVTFSASKLYHISDIHSKIISYIYNSEEEVAKIKQDTVALNVATVVMQRSFERFRQLESIDFSRPLQPSEIDSWRGRTLMARGMLRMDLGTLEAFKDDRFPISGHVAGIIEDWLKAEEDVWINLMAFLEDGPSGDANRKNDLLVKKFADSLFAHGQRTSSIVASLQRCADREEEESRRYRREFESIRKLIDLAKRDLFTYSILLCVGVGCLSLAVRELVFPMKHRKQKKESL